MLGGKGWSVLLPSLPSSPWSPWAWEESCWGGSDGVPVPGSVCPPAGEGEASTRCLWALCVSLGLDSDCSALLGSSGGCGFVLLLMPYCVSL